MYKRNSKGFTIIELMAVVAIVSILAVIALAAYSDYAVRAQVSEGLALATEVKTGVTQAYYIENNMPNTNSEAGVADAADYQTDIVNSIGVGASGVITINYNPSLIGARNKLLLIPTPDPNGILQWSCQPASGADGIKENHVPPACRG